MKTSNFAFFRYILYMVSGLIAYKYFGFPMVAILALTFTMLEVVSKGLLVTYEQVSVLKQMIFLQQVSSFYSSNLELVLEQVSEEDLAAYEASPDSEEAIDNLLIAARVNGESTLELPLELKKRIADELYQLCRAEDEEKEGTEDLTDNSESDIK